MSTFLHVLGAALMVVGVVVVVAIIVIILIAGWIASTPNFFR